MNIKEIGTTIRKRRQSLNINQTELSELAGIPLVDVLVKLGDADQRVLGRMGRQARARDAYRVLERVDERRILLLDDVITTGATIVAATRTLRGAGAVHVDALALARVLQ